MSGTPRRHSAGVVAIAAVAVAATPLSAQLRPSGGSEFTRPASIMAVEAAEHRCSVEVLWYQDGYRYTEGQIRQFVRETDAVVRAVAVDSIAALPYEYRGWIRFRPTEILRGPFPNREFWLQGSLVDRDDFNQDPVPYRMVRPAGQRGDCFASEYRLGREYLFLLKKDAGGLLTPWWAALAPLNEQISGREDPWLRWVRERLPRGAGECRPPAPPSWSPLDRVRSMVSEANAIVRAVAIDSMGPLPYERNGWVRFRPLEILRGPFPDREFLLEGRLVEHDDFNEGSVPYLRVRSSGRWDCFTNEYRLGGEYLLLLWKDYHGLLTLFWSLGSPINEQIRGADDPWVTWVRGEMRQR